MSNAVTRALGIAAAALLFRHRTHGVGTTGDWLPAWPSHAVVRS